MFKTLLIKEWKDKALVALFGLAMMAVFLAAFVGFGGDRDLREIVPAGFLIVFFPFLGLMLGAGAFEAEFRDGAWAYLFSRPVRKETVWLAKLVALLSILGVFGLAFLGLMAAFPELGRVIAGFKFPELLEAGLDLFPLVLLSSLFYFSVAFALSILSEKQLGLVLGSLVLGVIVQGALSFIAYRAELRGWLSNAGRLPWLDAYKLALVLSSLALLAASLVTFRKADFSQPRRKAASLAKYAVLFLSAAWLLSGLWPALRPGPPEQITSAVDVIGDAAYFATTKGFYRYDAGEDSLDKLARWRSQGAWTVIGGGKVLYVTVTDPDEHPQLRVLGLDGSGKRLLLGPGAEDQTLDWQPWSLALSPDGQKAVSLGRETNEGVEPRSAPSFLWLVRTDGSGSKRLPPLAPDLQMKGDRPAWVSIVGWNALTDSIILMARRAGETGMALWTYDLATAAQRRLFEAERLGYPAVSPGGKAVLVVRRPGLAGPVEAVLVDVASGETVTVAKMESGKDPLYGSFMGFAWSRSGDEVAFFIRKAGGVVAPAYFSRPERRLVEAGGLPSGDMTVNGPSVGWAAGDSKLVLGLPNDRSVKVFDRGLAELQRVAVPEAVPAMFYVRAAGESVFLHAFGDEGVWRLDLKTEKWKKIW